MTDVFSPKKRSWIMGRIRGKNTTSELKIRSLLHRLGFRFRLHHKELPGKPDIIFHSRKAIIFVHGCFWHGHTCNRGNRKPKTNASYWGNKIKKNVERDTLHHAKLEALGWKILVIWECEINNTQKLSKRLHSFLKAPHITKDKDQKPPRRGKSSKDTGFPPARE